MRIVHVSYASIKSHSEPLSWLKQIDFFTGIVTSMARKHEVHSVHCINYSGVLNYKGGTYHFFKLNSWLSFFSFRLNRYIKKLNPEVIIIHSFLYPWQVRLLKSLLPQSKIFVQHHAEKPRRFPRYWLQRWAD